MLRYSPLSFLLLLVAIVLFSVVDAKAGEIEKQLKAQVDEVCTQRRGGKVATSTSLASQQRCSAAVTLAANLIAVPLDASSEHLVSLASVHLAIKTGEQRLKTIGHTDAEIAIYSGLAKALDLYLQRHEILLRPLSENFSSINQVQKSRSRSLVYLGVSDSPSGAIQITAWLERDAERILPGLVFEKLDLGRRGLPRQKEAVVLKVSTSGDSLRIVSSGSMSGDFDTYVSENIEAPLWLGLLYKSLGVRDITYSWDAELKEELFASSDACPPRFAGYYLPPITIVGRRDLKNSSNAKSGLLGAVESGELLYPLANYSSGHEVALEMNGRTCVFATRTGNVGWVNLKEQTRRGR